MTLLVDPIGDFPLGDDWSYGRVVQTLVETGSFRYTDWVSMPLVAQALWGALFCLPVGFSFTALRISTLILGLVGILATYQLIRQFGAKSNAALLAALLIATNPLYFALSNSFFTDVPFYALTTLSLLLFVHGIKHGRIGAYAGGIVLACVAVLVRQIGIVLPVAIAIAVIVKNRIGRSTLFMAILAPLAVFTVYFGYNHLIESTIGQPELYNLKIDEFIGRLQLPLPRLLWNLFSRSSTALLYLGLFLLPASLASLPGRWRSLAPRDRWVSALLFCVFVSLPALYLVIIGRLMPVGDNWIYDIGLGTPTLTDVFTLNLPHLPSAPKTVWIAVTLSSLAGAGLLMECLVSTAIRSFAESDPVDRNQKWITVLVWTYSLAYLAPLAVAGFFDRYLIMLLPLLLIPILVHPIDLGISSRPGSLLPACAVMLILAFFSISGTHDYLSWNRARWDALDYLVDQKGISPHIIDGGFEFNGWHYDAGSGMRPKRKWWVYDDAYMVTFGPVRGYQTLRRFVYERWLSMDEGTILILRRPPLDRSSALRRSG